ncbi:MAG TPA: PqqD family protein [Bacteroidales bacterium]|nr:PqqD family protein [Bacteroidales bacterium]
MHKKTYLRNPEPITGSLHDHLVMLDIQKGKYFSLNPVAARIWEILENPHTLEEVCSKLLDEYDVSQEQCQQEVEEYLLEMKNLELVLQV